MKYTYLAPSATSLTWQEVIMTNETIKEVNALKKILSVKDKPLHPSLKSKGQIILFYGNATKTKINVAALLGKEVNKPVCKIDLSALSSSYISETEKNIEMLLAEATKAGAILFFDEADALFSKKINVKDSHDKYANLDIAYLLQRLEDYKGFTIIQSKAKDNIDTLFSRRFFKIIHFSE